MSYASRSLQTLAGRKETVMHREQLRDPEAEVPPPGKKRSGGQRNEK